MAKGLRNPAESAIYSGQHPVEANKCEQKGEIQKWLEANDNLIAALAKDVNTLSVRLSPILSSPPPPSPKEELETRVTVMGNALANQYAQLSDIKETVYQILQTLEL